MSMNKLKMKATDSLYNHKFHFLFIIKINNPQSYKTLLLQTQNVKQTFKISYVTRTVQQYETTYIRPLKTLW